MAKNQPKQKQVKVESAKAEKARRSPNKEGLSLSTKLALLLAVVAIVLYANTLGNGYVLDDSTVIKSNSIVTQGISAIPQIFATPYRRGWFITNNDFYRPLSLAMFAAEYQLSDGSPVISHFMNVVFFAGCAALLFLFFDALFDKKKTIMAFVAVLLFTVHPIHTEVVANIKSRDELLCFFFVFLSLNAFLKYARDGKPAYLLMGSISLFFSFLSKETSITFLGIIPFTFFFYSNQDKKRSLHVTLSTFSVAFVFLAIRYLVLKAYDANSSSTVTFMDNMLSAAPSAMSRLATEILILGNYIKLLFIPYPLICDYSYKTIPFTSFSDIRVIISMLAYIILLAWAVFLLIKKTRNGYAYGILFCLATISLFSNIPFLIGSAMAERFLFFPSAGFCLIVALIIDNYLVGQEKQKLSSLANAKVMSVLAPVVLVFSGMTIDRNSDWKDNITLFTTDIKSAPDDARLNYYIGTEITAERVKLEQNPSIKGQIVDSGIVYLKKALSTYRDYDDANASLGDAYFKTLRYDSAEYYDKRALEINPKYAIALNNLAGVYFVKGNYQLAKDYCQKAFAVNPFYSNAYSNLGLCYMRLNQKDSALINLYKAVSIDRTGTSAYDNLINFYKAENKPDSVIKYQTILQQLTKGI